MSTPHCFSAFFFIKEYVARHKVSSCCRNYVMAERLQVKLNFVFIE